MDGGDVELPSPFAWPTISSSRHHRPPHPPRRHRLVIDYKYTAPRASAVYVQATNRAARPGGLYLIAAEEVFTSPRFLYCRHQEARRLGRLATLGDSTPPSHRRAQVRSHGTGSRASLARPRRHPPGRIEPRPPTPTSALLRFADVCRIETLPAAAVAGAAE